MNREIEYKFWLGHIGKMTYAHTLQEIGEIIPEFTDDIIPLEYIGVNDKKGTPICEADIITTPNGNWGVIVKKDHCFEVTVSESQSSLYTKEFLQGSIVIGNKYETPELMK